ncbi:hypothetical protein JDM601_2816 [Mycolicibacter sinensis]|uniref:Uncharacterized protein n=1 Tax=Mycolicibacter sinensis (strain JDM601) TaxID=875328 RepID=F5YZF2_MYCSD|nr:hypothetical protein JDM601_2816 [Mycolicibacter sinensis]
MHLRWRCDPDRGHWRLTSRRDQRTHPVAVRGTAPQSANRDLTHVLKVALPNLTLEPCAELGDRPHSCPKVSSDAGQSRVVKSR